MIIDGKALSIEILQQLKEKRKNFDKLKIAAFLIGRNNEKLSFLKIKEKFAQELNIEFRIYEIDEKEKKKKIRKYISQVMKSKRIQGGIIQLPLPENLPAQYILNSVTPKKDIDCLCSRLLGKFYTDTSVIRPLTVEVVDFLKEKYNLSFKSKNILIVGYGKLVGKPLTHYFLTQGATVTVVNSKTKNLKNYFQNFDIIISGVGKGNLVDDCQEGAILIDFGYSFENNKIYGDIDFEKLKNKANLITPTPGGTGPILVAKFFENFFKLLEYKKII